DEQEGLSGDGESHPSEEEKGTPRRRSGGRAFVESAKFRDEPVRVSLIQKGDHEYGQSHRDRRSGLRGKRTAGSGVRDEGIQRKGEEENLPSEPNFLE